MKLDFSALAQPAEKARGQVGTTGTQAFMRVCASPLAQPGAGTTGDKPAAVALVADLAVAALAACPPVSPACPQVAGDEKLNTGAVSPVSPLVPTETAQVAALVSKPLVSSECSSPPHANGNTCADCLHLLRRGTCGEPVAAGLLPPAEGFGIVWPPEGHGAGCEFFKDKVPAKVTATMVTGKVSPPQSTSNPKPGGSATHGGTDWPDARCWDDAKIATFTARTERFALLGRADADDLAERLTRRDRDRDDRRLCLECTWLGDAGRCLAAATGRIPGADRRLEPVQTVLQRCGAFGLRKGLV